MEHSIEYLKSYCGSSEDHNFEDYVAEKEYLAKKEGVLDTAKKYVKEMYISKRYYGNYWFN